VEASPADQNEVLINIEITIEALQPDIHILQT